MILDQLRDKVQTLPLQPGVYLMKDKTGTVIYVGKAKKLKNRVSQYFQDSASHTAKTRLMVSKIHSFDVIVATTEFEALVLECSLIKQYKPKYNILLKDDKGYPYICLDMKSPYPSISIINKPNNDDDMVCFGPFGSRSTTQMLIKTVKQTLKLPNCAKKFPRDIGKGRPCLHYHMNQCLGWCQGDSTQEQYLGRVVQAKKLFAGQYREVADQVRQEMLDAAQALKFELAASLRDKLQSVEILGKKQLVTAGRFADVDVVGYAQTDTKGCFVVLHYIDGNLVDKEHQIYEAAEEPAQALSSLLKQYYLSLGTAPKLVLLPYEVEDMMLFGQLLEEKFGRKTQFRVPQRGDKVRLTELAQKNALEEAERVTDDTERTNRTLELLGKMLSIPTPARIEAYDISNISGTDIVASMVVFKDGKPCKSEYKHFKIDDLENQDDYRSMYQAVKRRFLRYLEQDSAFAEKPDLLLIDGGEIHARIAKSVLSELGLEIPVFGMVKDDRHRTRCLITADAEQIRIDAKQSVFALVGNIQEETHRFAIKYHRTLRSRRLQYSELDKIKGIGAKRKHLILKNFGSITAIRSATLQELERLLPKDAAFAVYEHFNHSGGV